jgi:anaerobic selenocysteine-containing dehydrogenase
VDGFEDYMALARRYTLAERRGSAASTSASCASSPSGTHDQARRVITVGNGLERNKNGGSGIRAVFALPALAGKFGVPGGGLINGAGFASRRRRRGWRARTSVPPAPG